MIAQRYLYNGPLHTWLELKPIQVTRAVTLKFLVATMPTGEITFISKCWGGHVSYKNLTMNSGLLKLLHHGDMVIADCGFDVGNELAFVGSTLEFPPFTNKKLQLSMRGID